MQYDPVDRKHTYILISIISLQQEDSQKKCNLRVISQDVLRPPSALAEQAGKGAGS